MRIKVFRLIYMDLLILPPSTVTSADAVLRVFFISETF